MAMKLFAHVLRSEFAVVGSGAPAMTGSPESRRWVFRDLVVRRHGYAAWGLSGPTAPIAAKPGHEPSAEPLWPDTQPCCHE